MRENSLDAIKYHVDSGLFAKEDLPVFVNGETETDGLFYDPSDDTFVVVHESRAIKMKKQEKANESN